MPEENTQDTNEQVDQVNTQGEEQPEDLSASEAQTDEVEQSTDEELPEDTKERTRQQFEKLKQSNAELKKQLEERQQLPSVLDYLGQMPEVDPQLVQKYAQLPQQQQQQIQNQPGLLDDSGYLNADVLEQRLAAIEEAQKRAEEAERRAIEAQQRIARFEQDAEQKRLYAEYPELDPMNENFNKDAYDLVRNELAAQLVNTGQRDALQAAQRMSKYFRQQTQEQPKAVQQRNQAVSKSGSQPRQSSKPVSQMTTAERLAAWEARNNIK